MTFVSSLLVGKYFFNFLKNRVEDVVKRVHKMIHTLQTLHNDIVGLLYDIKELVTSYRGNLIVLCVAVAVGFFNHNRPNAGMFLNFFLKKVHCEI